MAHLSPSFHLSDFENLQEDLVLLQTTLEQRRMDPLRIQAQCGDILKAVAGISEEHLLMEYANVVHQLADFVHEAARPVDALTGDFWRLTLDVMDELLAALEMAESGLKVDKTAMQRHIADFDSRLDELRGAPAAPPARTPAAEPEEGTPAMATHTASQDQDAPKAVGARKDTQPGSAQELLRRAAEAAAAGRDDEAQALALQAAETIATHARQQRETKLRDLRNKLLTVDGEIEDIESELADVRMERERRRETMEQSTELRDEAQQAYLQHAEVFEQVKAELEDVERRMAELQSRQEELMLQFEEALPAKEAAERTYQQAGAEIEAQETASREAEARIQELERVLDEIHQQRTTLQDSIVTLERGVGA